MVLLKTYGTELIYSYLFKEFLNFWWLLKLLQIFAPHIRRFYGPNEQRFFATYAHLRLVSHFSVALLLFWPPLWSGMWSPSEARVVFQLTAGRAAAYGINLNCFHLRQPKDDGHAVGLRMATQRSQYRWWYRSHIQSQIRAKRRPKRRRPAVCAVTRWLCWPHIGLGPSPSQNMN